MVGRGRCSDEAQNFWQGSASSSCFRGHLLVSPPLLFPFPLHSSSHPPAAVKGREIQSYGSTLPKLLWPCYSLTNSTPRIHSLSLAPRSCNSASNLEEGKQTRGSAAAVCGGKPILRRWEGGKGTKIFRSKMMGKLLRHIPLTNTPPTVTGNNWLCGAEGIAHPQFYQSVCFSFRSDVTR